MFITPASVTAVTVQGVVVVVVEIVEDVLLATVLTPVRLTTPAAVAPAAAPVEITPPAQYKLSILIVVPASAMNEPASMRGLFIFTVAPVTVVKVVPLL